MRKYIVVVLFSSLFVGTSFAQDAHEELKKYLNDVVQKVKNTDNAEEKREILDKTFHKLLDAADYIEAWPLTSEKDKAAVNELKKKTEDKLNELNGNKGFAKVADKDLNRFADYTIQEIEQAAEYITISVVTLVLIIILVAILL